MAKGIRFTDEFSVVSGSINSGLRFAVAGGTLQPTGVNASLMLSHTNSTTVESGATLDIGGINTTLNRLSGAGTVTNSGAVDRVLGLKNTSTFSGVIEDGPTNIISVERNGGGTTALGGGNTYTGATTVNGGILALNATGSILNTSGITIAAAGTLNVDGAGNALSDTVTINNEGTFELSGSDETIGAIFGAGDIVLGANTLTTGDATDVEIAGAISGTGNLIYQGTGALELSGDSTMTGDIQNIGGGTLSLSGSTTGGVVNTVGTFNNTGEIEGTVTNEVGAVFNTNTGGIYGGDINNDGAFNIGNTTFGLNGTFTNEGTVTNTSGGALTFTVGTGANFINNGAVVGGTGGITLTGDEYTIGAGSTLTDVTLDVDNLTANANYILSGVTDYNFTNNATATVVANANFSGDDLTNTDLVNVSGGDLVGVGAIDNSGTINIGDGAGSPHTLEAVSLTNTGTINVNDGSSLIGTGNTTNNSGVVNVAGGGALVEVTGDYNNLAGGEVNFNGGVTTVNSVGGAIENSGTIAIAAGATMDATGDTLNNNTGGVVNSAGTLNGNVVNQGSGDFNILGGLDAWPVGFEFVRY